jgi:hypothetical protein
MTAIAPSPFGIGWFILYGYFGVPTVQFMPELRALGARRTKIYLFWQQLEPEPGRYDWTAADAFVDQLAAPEEGLIALFSSSMWATRTRAAMLPPSPALDLAQYRELVYQMVRRYRGRVRYWQNDCEPTNPVFWAGNAEEFVAQLRVFSSAVREADPEAVVVLGGHDGLFRPRELELGRGFPGQDEGLAFFDHVVANARDAFDLFDLRLYADPYTIVPRVEHMRGRLAALNATQPIVCTEYGGPGLFEFAENRGLVSLMSTWSSAATRTIDASGVPTSDATSTQRIAELYDEMATLPPQTQMFMQGCTPELEAKLRRLQSRDLVQRNLLALSAGMEWTMYWELAAAPGPRDDLMTLMFGKVGLLGASDDGLRVVSPVAEAFARMAHTLGDVSAVERVELADRPEVFLFRIERRDGAPMYVAWERRDTFTGEDLPSTALQIPWDAPAVRATDVFGASVDARVEAGAGALRLPLSVTPVYVSAHE